MKNGWGTGSSSTIAFQYAVAIQVKQENDDLGQVWVNYADPIILGFASPVAQVYIYTTGYVDFMVVPIKLY